MLCCPGDPFCESNGNHICKGLCKFLPPGFSKLNIYFKCLGYISTQDCHISYMYLVPIIVCNVNLEYENSAILFFGFFLKRKSNFYEKYVTGIVFDYIHMIFLVGIVNILGNINEYLLGYLRLKESVKPHFCFVLCVLMI